MELLEALKNRRVTRAFTGKQVQPEVINEILKIATNAPSGSNLQPWEIYVVGGDKKDTLCQRISTAFHDGQRVTAPKYSVPLPGKYSDRTSKLFKDLKPYLDELEVGNNHIVEGSLRYFDAPVAIMIFIHESLAPLRLPCIGSFMAYLMLAAQAHGIGSCPIGYVRVVENEIRNFLHIPDDMKFVISVALGYPDEMNPINRFKAGRTSLDEICTFVD